MSYDDPKRMTQAQLLEFVHDPHPMKRFKVAKLLDEGSLHLMAKDEMAAIRAIVASRVPMQYLSEMIDDESASVRAKVVERVDVSYLPSMIDDSNYEVRRNVAMRIDPRYLVRMMNDPDFSVRCRVAARIDRSNALLMSATDRVPMVRKIALGNALGELKNELE